MGKRYLRLSVLLTILVFAFSSCKLITNILNTEITPAQKNIIYSKADSQKFRKIRRLRSSGLNKITLKKGQWVTYLSKMKRQDRDVSLITVKVISARRGTVVLETETYSASNNGVRNVSQVTFENYPVRQKLSYTASDHRRFFNNVKIVRIRTKNGDGPVREVPQQVIAMGMMGAKSISNVRSGNMKKVAYGTKYIRSKRCYKYNYNVQAMGITDRGTVYAHSSVPVLGYIRMISDMADNTVIAYGYRGARSVM